MVGWVGLGKVTQLLSWVGLGLSHDGLGCKKWTHVHVCVTSILKCTHR